MLGYYSIGILGSGRVEMKLMMYNVERNSLGDGSSGPVAKVQG